VTGKRLTWVAGDRPADKLDEASGKNLAAGRAGLRSNTTSSDKAMQYAGGFTASAPGTSGTSIFDPVLCELAYTWFCPPNGAVLDPFAGGSVRGIVAAVLGRQYTGIDLRPEQIAANVEQAQAITPNNMPRWIVGDSREAMPDEQFDLVFSCPPYADLEVYSDDPRDISTMAYPDFMEAYRAIVAGAVQRLRNDRFACFVVGDVRDKKGMYYNFVSDTIAAFQDAGAKLYNEAILVTAVGSLPIRVGKQFESGRKLGKTHQNVLVFVKGDPRKATQACGPVEIGDLQSANNVSA
jgi:DNA modification methylase